MEMHDSQNILTVKLMNAAQQKGLDLIMSIVPKAGFRTLWGPESRHFWTADSWLGLLSGISCMMPSQQINMLCLTESQLQEYLENGVVVIPSVLTAEEVQSAKNGLEECLIQRTGFDPDNLEQTSHLLSSLSSTNGSGGVLDIFYENWKLKLNEHPKVVSIIQDLWSQTYAAYSDVNKSNEEPDQEVFAHPFGPINPREGYMYVDRICYRLPSAISGGSAPDSKKKKQTQRSLTPHLDCCPHNMHKGRKWRPIQAFIALTDTMEPDQGGFEACPGLHKEFYTWAASRVGSKPVNPRPGDEGKLLQPPCVGDFTPIRPSEDSGIIDRFRHIPCRAGDMVCWDVRIPHANARYNTLSTPRQVVYIGLLPAVPLNREYAQTHLLRYQCGELPNDQWHSQKGLQHCSYEFSELGRKLMGIDDWQSASQSLPPPPQAESSLLNDGEVYAISDDCHGSRGNVDKKENVKGSYADCGDDSSANVNNS